MEDFSTIGVIVLFSALIISRIISEKALKQLSADQKVSIVDSFSKMRMYNMIPLVLILAGYYFIENVTSFNSHTPYILFLVILILFIVGIQVISIKKLKSLELPATYIKKYFTSQVITITAFLTWAGFTIYPLIYACG